MKIEKLHLTNFRNQFQSTFEFSEINIIVGENASGKSSILEAINLLSTGKSNRADYEKEMITLGKDIAKIEGHTKRDGEKLKLEVKLINSDKYANLARKQIKVNGVAKALNSLIGNFNSILFTPLDLNMLIEGPSLRRKYIDAILIQTNKEYRKAIRDLTKIIRQRNKLLEKIRDFGTGRTELKYWDDLLLSCSEKIHFHRSELFDFINSIISRYGKDLNGPDSVFRLEYKQSLVTKARLEEYKDREIASKSTLIGPNRDDFAVYMNERNLETYGSRGQQRTSILALKLCEIDFITEKTSFRPVLLLDDIFSELDEAHKEKVFEVVDMQQTIITTTDLENIRNNLKKYNIIKL